jgi:hypothetical protein
LNEGTGHLFGAFTLFKLKKGDIFEKPKEHYHRRFIGCDHDCCDCTI